VELSQRITTILTLDPEADAIEFEAHWCSWGDLHAVATRVAGMIDAGGVPFGGPVGLVLRNDPAMIAAVLGTLVAGRCVVTISPHQSDESLAGELRDLAVPAVVALPADWARAGVRDAATGIGAMGVEVTIATDADAHLVPGLERVDPVVAHRPVVPGVAVEMLTSGTTGPPKRVPLTYQAFERTITAAGAHYRSDGTRDDTPHLRSGVAIVASPLVHMSGIFRTLLNITDGRRIALLERFRVDEFVALVEHHRPKAVSLVPTALRMVLDADVAPESLSSIHVVTSGSAALPVAVQEAFETKYGIAVLPSYGATEFAGGVAGWTLPLHREWGEAKRGSVGRPQPGRELRVIDVETGGELPVDTAGRLEVRRRDTDWVRTTDVARIDADGFLWIEGRSDDAIVRGGFKVFPGEIVDALRAHPAVRDAGVTGIDDDRLGAVPVAAVELRDGTSVTEEQLEDHLRLHLKSYQLPTELRIVDALPRTPSMKVSQPQLRELFVKADER
jgi:acyl-CoA synthetase (AMP-forming)/AMP-acid ligase II